MGDKNMAESIRTYSLPSNDLSKSPECRFDAGNYSPELLNARASLQASGLKLESLGNLVGAVRLPGRTRRIYVDSDTGIPFLQGSDVVRFQAADLKYLSPKSHRNIEFYLIRAGWLLVTRSGTVGRVTLCPAEWDGWAASEHIIRIVPDEEKCPAGYLCAFLSSPLGQIQLTASIYGAVVDELTDEHVANVRVPIPEDEDDWKFLESIDATMKRSVELKSQAVVAAQSSVASTTAWLQSSDEAGGRKADLRIPNTTPEQLAQSLLSGGAKPRPETKRREAS